MADRVIIITGASDGIGAAAARQVAGSREPSPAGGAVARRRLAKVATEIGANTSSPTSRASTTSGNSRPRSAPAVDHIDVLANNAGALFGDRTETVDGYEKTLQVNHLAPFLLTNLLLDLLQAGEGVVINTASSAAKVYGRFDGDDLENAVDYNPTKAYGDAKLNNILFTRGLNNRFGSEGIRSVAFDPGNVATNFANDTDSYLRFVWRTPLRRLVLITPEQGGSNLAFFINGTPGVTWRTDQFYTQTKPATASQTNPQILSDEFADRLWQASARMVGLAGGRIHS